MRNLFKRAKFHLAALMLHRAAPQIFLSGDHANDPAYLTLSFGLDTLSSADCP